MSKSKSKKEELYDEILKHANRVAVLDAFKDACEGTARQEAEGRTLAAVSNLIAVVIAYQKA